MTRAGDHFVWTPITDQPGEPLDRILARKEAERRTGGDFWWGVHASIGQAGLNSAQQAGGALPVVFWDTRERTEPHEVDRMFVLTKWKDENGALHDLPQHVLILESSDDSKTYALVCCSCKPLMSADEWFDLDLCRTLDDNKSPRRSTVLLKMGFAKGFRATLVAPWSVRLAEPRQLTGAQWERIRKWRPGEDWLGLVQSVRGFGGAR